MSNTKKVLKNLHLEKESKHEISYKIIQKSIVSIIRILCRYNMLLKKY